MTGRPHVGFVLERSLGHITHGENLKRLLPAETAVDAEVIDVPFDVSGIAERVPGFRSNWTIRSGLRARRAVRHASRRRPFDALFVHTQVPAVLMPDWLARIPTVVSLDATPLQYDELGEGYGHDVGDPSSERLKWRLNRLAFRRAAHIVAWTAWAKQGVVDGYGISPGKITVVPPGVVAGLWAPAPRPATDVMRVLFVGADLARKGGDVLVAAVTELRRLLAAEGSRVTVELDVVTKDDVALAPGVRVHKGLVPNSPELIALFREADVFCLPSGADCLPMVLSEAGAAGLPLVSTAVAGIPEIVRPGETGLVVPPGDRDALVTALRTMAEQPDLRRRLGDGARRLVLDHFDAEKNAHRIVEIIGEVLDRRRPQRTLLTVSGTIPDDLDEQIEQGRRPRPDYVAMARAMDAELLDVPEARRRGGAVGMLVERALGAPALLAWVCFRERSGRRAIVTDGEQVGIPLAALCRLTSRRPFAHVMVVHIMSVPKKAVPYRALRLGRYIDTMVVYSSEQRRFIVEELGFPADRTVLTSFAVDTTFFSPARARTNGTRQVATAGLEFRDYPTLIEAAGGIDAKVVIAAASPWSKRTDSTAGVDVPDNVEVCRLGFVDLRQLYADSDVVVMPLRETPFQAGITTILEAMAMGRPVVCTRTTGQTDTIVDGVNGIYVPPGDAGRLRTAVIELLDDDAGRDRLGGNARRFAEETADVDVYARRLAAVVDAAARRARR